MRKFQLPSNIKQIGSIDDGIRFYIEDYVVTFVNKLAESGGDRCAFLIGKYLLIDAQPVLFITGAIDCKHLSSDTDIPLPDEKSFDYASDIIAEYFDGFDIVGWARSQTGYGAFLNPFAAEFHKTKFSKEYQTMFVVDPVEHESVFYVWSSDKHELVESSGYFIYYDKNEAMQRYMASLKSAPILNIPFESSGKTEERSRRSLPRIEATDRTGHQKESAKARGGGEDGRRLVNMLVSLSAVLFVIAFIMGAGLIQSDGRITKLETDLTALRQMTDSLAGQWRQQGDLPVFAPEDNTSPLGLEPDASPGKNTLTTETPPLDEQTEGQESETQTETPTETITEAPTETPTETPTEAPTETPTEAPTEAPTEPISTEQAETEPLPPTQSNEPRTYEVQSGDSLNYISRMFYGTGSKVKDIMKANGLTDSDKIYIGMKLIIP